MTNTTTAPIRVIEIEINARTHFLPGRVDMHETIEQTLRDRTILLGILPSGSQMSLEIVGFDSHHVPKRGNGLVRFEMEIAAMVKLPSDVIDVDLPVMLNRMLKNRHFVAEIAHTPDDGIPDFQTWEVVSYEWNPSAPGLYESMHPDLAFKDDNQDDDAKDDLIDNISHVVFEKLPDRLTAKLYGDNASDLLIRINDAITPIVNDIWV